MKVLEVFVDGVTGRGIRKDDLSVWCVDLVGVPPW